jgi:hypothetical protein
VDGFIATFKFKVKGKTFSSGNANGVVFVVQNTGAGKLGNRCSSGICHGYQGIGNSFGVVFDT